MRSAVTAAAPIDENAGQTGLPGVIPPRALGVLIAEV